VWSDLDDEVIGGDLTAALAYATPAGGSVLTPVSPCGLRDRSAGTVSFTTSLGFGRKLERIRVNPRVVVTVHVVRVLSWHDLACTGEPTVVGTPRPHGDPPSQDPPQKGTGPRIDVPRAARRVSRLPHALLAYLSGDGFPVVAPVKIGAADSEGIALEGPLPGGGRRAGLLVHRYEAQLIGLEVRQYTGWLQDGGYAPHTESGFRAPANKTILLLANGFMARRGLKRARATSSA
jgi:hypothetical protein